MALLIACAQDQITKAFSFRIVDERGAIVLVADVTVAGTGGGYSRSYGFPPLVGEESVVLYLEGRPGRTSVVVEAVGFLPFDGFVDVEGTAEVILQDDPNPLAECEGRCANEVACGGQGAAAGEAACVEACLAELALTGTEFADACRPLRVVQTYCLGLLDCDGFLAFERGDPNDCAAIPTAIADCESDGAFGP